MGKKPKLALVELTAATLPAPATLGKTGATLWRSIQTEYRIIDSGGVETLLQICRAADRAAEYGTVIDRDGPMISTKHGPKEHPLLKHELAARAFVVRGLQRLGLNVEAVKPIGRPGGGVGWIPPV